MRRVKSLLVVLFVMISVASFASFVDISNSPYGLAIEKLVKAGVVSAQDDYFKPAEPLSREEAAVWIVRTFKLSTIKPMKLAEDVQKKFVYESPLGVIDEAFVVPSAKDTLELDSEEYVEGLIKVRAMGVENGFFRPFEAITGVEFSNALARVIFGVDEPVNYSEKLAELIYIPEQMLELDRPITREEAAQVLSNFVNNPDFQVITFLVTADIHGHIEPYSPAGAKYPVGAMEKMAYYVASERENQSELLLLDVGDAPYNTNVANLFEGEPVMKIMNMMGYDAMVLGNHDFDFPLSVMERNSKLAKFPFLGGNTYYEGEPIPFLKPYVIEEVGGLKVAIVGLTDDSSAWYTHPRNVEGITFKEQYSAASDLLAEVAPKADLVVALAHLHTGNRVLPVKVPGYDLVFEGGRDVVAFPEKINGSWVISSGKHAELISKTNLNVLNGEVIGMNFAHVFMSANLPQDQKVVELVSGYVSSLDERMNNVIGKSEVDLDGERGTVRLKESNLANAIADSLREFADSDFAIQNGGGVRASVAKGDLTIKDIYTVLPFDNLVVTVRVTGQEVWETLEHGVSAYPAAAGQFLQVSGLEYTFDASKEPYKRLVSVTVDGEPIELNKTYTLTANDFLTGGGDKYTMLLDAEKVLVTKSFLRDVFAEYVAKHGTISPEVEGRITILNPAN